MEKLIFSSGVREKSLLGSKIKYNIFNKIKEHLYSKKMNNPEYSDSLHSHLYEKMKAGEITEEEWSKYCLQYLRHLLKEEYPENFNKNE